MRSIVEDVGCLKVADGSRRHVVECSPVGASQSHGMIERAIQCVSGQTQVLLSALEEKWGSLICCIVEYAGVLLNRFEVGVDERTRAEQRNESNNFWQRHLHRRGSAVEKEEGHLGR